MDTTKRRQFYPSRPALQQGWLPVDAQHKLYFEVSGNPAGIPVVYLHGGPGGSVHPNARRFFDPVTYKLIMFDQRGCGRSEPHCSLENNTTQALVSDIEALRTHLNIEDWLVFGGSWGSTLALAYAQSHPTRVQGLILRGLFMGRDLEINWFMTGCRHTFPDVWLPFSAHVEETEAMPMLDAYIERLTSKDHSIRLAAARAWSTYESSLVTLIPSKEIKSQALEPEIALPIALLEAHYFKHRMFLEPDQLLNNLDAIRHIPSVLVHGRYDMICPTSTAFDLMQAWPELDVHLIPDAGHASTEPGTATALMNALDKFAKRQAPPIPPTLVTI